MAKTYTVEERRRHVEQWRRSGLSQRAYCAKHALPWTAFKNWQRSPVVKAAVPVMAPVQLDGGAGDQWRIEAGGGVQVVIPAHTDAESLRRLFVALRACDAT